MIRYGVLLIALLLVSALGASPLAAQQLLTRPEIPGYETPQWTTQTQSAQPRTTALEYCDVAYLIIATALASWLALGFRRRWAILAVSIFSLLWLGFWRQGCVCSIGAIQNVALAIADPTYRLPLFVTIFFVTPLLFTLFFGRAFCGAVCPLGAAQEVVCLRPVKVPEWLDHLLGLFPYIYLALAIVWAAGKAGFVICEYDPFVSFFRLSGSANMLAIGACFLIVGIFVGRPYCRYFCPLGAMFRLLAPLTAYRVKVTPDECINCRLCEDACPYGAIRTPTPPLSAELRRKLRRSLAIAVVATPLVITLFALIGHQLGNPLARMHFTVQLAERVYLEQIGQVSGTTDASEAFYKSGKRPAELYAEAGNIIRWFKTAGVFLGVWVGLIISAKVISLCRYQRRDGYDADPSRCFACGRCFWYCPTEQLRRGIIDKGTFLAMADEAKELAGKPNGSGG